MTEKRFFLDVKSSVSGQAWVERLDGKSRNTALAISQTLDLPELIGRVLAGREVELDDAEKFMAPAIRDLMPDPNVLTDMNIAADRIPDAITQKQQVAIFGDYDVDDAASSALMSKFLSHHGIKSEIYIPDRIFEGYGPNPEAIKTLIDNGAKLIITVDCGATSFEALAEARKLGVDVVVLDHHQMGEEGPVCVALVNPNRQDDLSGLGHLCAGGVVFMTLCSDTLSPPDLLSWLDLVALATVCDVVPLKGLNRAFVVKGLQVMAQQENIGLRALMRIGRLDGPPRPYHLGFVLGPRINAGGRIGDAALGSRLLTTDDDHLADEIAQQLENLNKERQAAEARMLEEAIAEADAEIGEGTAPAVIVTESEQWHPGIVGLLASRLKDRFKRPAFAIAFDRMGKGSGSGRSISGVDLGAVVRNAVDNAILEKGGGHAMAAGLTVKKNKLGELRAYFESQLSENVDAVRSNHSQPVFAFPAHQIRYAKVVGQNHVSFTASAGDGATLRGIAFRVADEEIGQLLLNSNGQPIHLVGTLNADFWQGQKRVQLRLMDVALQA